jgi:hypothetical protein
MRPAFERPYGTQTHARDADPAINRWAILAPSRWDGGRRIRLPIELPTSAVGERICFPPPKGSADEIAWTYYPWTVYIEEALRW